MQQYVEVILPLPLYSTFTYRISPSIEGEVKIGSRVLVPFGRKKYYTAIVMMLHNNAPTDYEVKDIQELLDDYPIIKYPQLKFWNWISEYYLCSLGDVYKAAVPAGLKVESETFVTINQDYEETEPANSENVSVLCSTTSEVATECNLLKLRTAQALKMLKR